jgi:hypothetical protein
MLAPHGGRLGLGRFLPNRIRCTSLGIFMHCSLCVCRVCDRTLRPFSVGGPFPCQQRSSFNPARPSTARQPVKCPLYARAIDIFGAAPTRHSNRSLPSSHVQESSSRNMNLVFNPVESAGSLIPVTQLVHKAAHSNVHYHPQRQEHEQHGRPTVTHQR